MDLATLKYFMVVAQTQHMTTAARQLNITQPSLSTSIRRLEADIGFQLFDRNGRGIQLNEYGRLFLEGVSAADTAVTGALAEMEKRRQGQVSFVRIACSSSSTNSRLIDLLLSRGLSLKVGNIPDNWEQELAANHCDLIITMGKSRHPRLESAPLRRLPLAVMASRRHALAGSASVTAGELSRHPFCSTSAPHSLSNIAVGQIRDHGFSPRITFLCRDSADMLKAIRTGAYLGLMGRHNLPQTEDLVILPVEDFHISLPIYLYWRRSDTENASLAALRQNIIAFYQNDVFPQ